MLIARILLLTGLGAAFTAEAGAGDGRPPFEESILRIEADYWRPDLTAELKVGVLGTRVDVKEDLAVADNDTFRVGVTLRVTDMNRFRLTYTRLDYAGDATIDRDIVFQGRVYSVNTQVLSSLDGGYMSGDYRFGVVRRDTFELDGIVGVKYADVDALLVSPNLGQRALASLKAPVPVVGVSARAYGGPVGFTGEFSGLTIGKRGTLYELDLRGRAMVSRHITGHVGYRRLHIRVDDEPDFGLFKPGGFYFGAEVGF